MDSASARLVIIQQLIADRHLDPNRASWAAVAMFPFDDSVKGGRRFRKEARRTADLFAARLAEISDDGVEILTLATLEQLRDIAETHGETFYVSHYSGVLTAASNPETPTLERKCSRCNAWFQGLEQECSECGAERKKVTISTV